MKHHIIKALDTLAGGILCYLIGLLSYKANRERQLPETPNRILLIRPGGIGDMLLLLPTIRLLQKRYNDVIIDVICESRNVCALELAEFDNVQPLLYSDNPLHLLLHLYRVSYDMVIDSEQFHRFSAVFAYLSGAPIRIGFKISPRRNPLYTHLVNYDLVGYEAYEFVKLLIEPGIIAHDVHLPINILNAQFDKSDEENKVIVVHPSASTDYKLWSVANFVQLLVKMHEKFPDYKFVIVGAEYERKYALDLHMQLLAYKIHVSVQNGKLSFKKTAELINNAALFLGSDSGLAHLAVLVDTPSVTLFGPSDVRKWGRQNAKHRCVFSHRSCAPCFIFGYHNPCRSKACMTDISVDDVFAEADSLLSENF